VPHYLIHIGPHKTGTTYLQHAFTRLRPELAARGILYPSQWGYGQHGHHDLPPALAHQDDEALESAFAAFNRSDADTILLSSETFSYAADADVRRLHALLAGQPATIVFYGRRWSELLPSSWREGVKAGSLATMPEFILSHLANPTATAVVDFGQVLDRFAAVFGLAALRVASYNSVREAGEDLLLHFCRNFLAWPDPPQTNFGRVNESLDMVDTEIIRVLNALEWTRTRGVSPFLFKNYIDAKPDLPIRWLVEKAMQFVVNRVRIDDTAPALVRLHADTAMRYETALVGPVPKAGLFEPRVADVNYIQSDYLLVDEVMETLRDMHRTLLDMGSGPS
jgi:hypothetical protein